MQPEAGAISLPNGRRPKEFRAEALTILAQSDGLVDQPGPRQSEQHKIEDIQQITHRGHPFPWFATGGVGRLSLAHAAAHMAVLVFLAAAAGARIVASDLLLAIANWLRFLRRFGAIDRFLLVATHLAGRRGRLLVRG